MASYVAGAFVLCVRGFRHQTPQSAAICKLRTHSIFTIALMMLECHQEKAPSSVPFHLTNYDEVRYEYVCT